MVVAKFVEDAVGGKGEAVADLILNLLGFFRQVGDSGGEFIRMLPKIVFFFPHNGGFRPGNFDFGAGVCHFLAGVGDVGAGRLDVGADDGEMFFGQKRFCSGLLEF